jgi:hypothetical protein
MLAILQALRRHHMDTAHDILGTRKIYVPLGSPLHDVVAGDGGGQPVEDLRLSATEGVEDGVVGGTGEGLLSVGRQTVGDNSLLGATACFGLAIVP